jgi:hypothetical protein
MEGASMLLHGLDVLQNCESVLRAGLVSNHLRAITPSEIDRNFLLSSLHEAGIEDVLIERVEPSLEDVFLALAARR